jgi:hypothetical protein
MDITNPHSDTNTTPINPKHRGEARSIKFCVGVNAYVGPLFIYFGTGTTGLEPQGYKVGPSLTSMRYDGEYFTNDLHFLHSLSTALSDAINQSTSR